MGGMKKLLEKGVDSFYTGEVTRIGGYDSHLVLDIQIENASYQFIDVLGREYKSVRVGDQVRIKSSDSYNLKDESGRVIETRYTIDTLVRIKADEEKQESLF